MRKSTHYDRGQHRNTGNGWVENAVKGVNHDVHRRP